MKDWLGNDFGPGDTVLYAAQSGRCVNMVLAEVVSINEQIFDEEEYRFVPSDQATYFDSAKRRTTVTVQPLKSSRWEQHYGRDRYIDTRTGKGINPWLDKHCASGGYRRDKLTGERVDDSNYSLRYGEYEYVPTVFKEYVKEIHEGPKPVTLTVTDNIVRMP
jgi:hypothetical protein